MIKRVEALYYKGFKYITPELANYNILVGPNASGKSSLLDIFIILKDVLNESPVAAVEKRCSNFRELIWNQERNYFELALEFQVPPAMNNLYTSARYEISLTYSDKEGIIIDNENLWLLKVLNSRSKKLKKIAQMNLFPHEPDALEHIIQQRKKSPVGWKKIVSKSSKGNDYFKSESTDWNIIYRFGPRKASLARIPEDEARFPISLWVKNILMEGIEFLQLNSMDMRWPCRRSVTMIKDLIVLVPDKNTKFLLNGLLSRYHSFGIKQISYDIFIHPERDPGIYYRAVNFLLTFNSQYGYALVFMDKEGSGQENKNTDQIAFEIRSKLEETGWQNRAGVIVFNTELEIWAWVNSPHLATHLGWESYSSLVDFVQQQGFWEQGLTKPTRPKEAIEAALRKKRIQRSSAIYQRIAKLVNFKNCQESSFMEFKSILMTWFAKDLVE